MINAILFDLDGTIIDSEIVAFKAIMDCFDQWGIKVHRSDASTVAGKKWEIAFDFLFKKYVLPVSKEIAASTILKRYKERMETEIAVVPGVVEAICYFAEEEKLKLALVSGSWREDILWALGKLNVVHHFSVILGAEDYPASKPAPDGFQKAIRLLGVKAAECIVFEDSVAGIASAHASGSKVVAITTTNHFGHDISHADFHLENYLNIKEDWKKISRG